MRISFIRVFIGLCCWFTQQVWTVAVAQDLREAPFGETKAQMAGPKAGIADGALSPALTGERRPLYRLRKSDVVEIGLTFTPEFNQTATVRPDGFIALKDIDDLYVEGETISKVRQAIRLAYSTMLHDPEVTVVLKDFDKPYFVANGEVSHPGKYELRSDTTVTEALAIAGGFTAQSKHSQVVLFRRLADGAVEARLINVKKMLASRNLDEDMHLRPGDMLFIPQNTISKIRRFMPSSSLSAYMNPAQF
jgi:polysaccharide export outer membrane protein